ncbi:MAG: RHS repeat-associated core domain-containing protein, partial [Candidatus Firestonebacteria bacterium]
RTRKTVGSTTTKYYYDGANCIAEIEGNTLKAIYVHGVEMISKRDISGTLYYLYDNIGNTVATVNWDGTVNTRYEYDAFGHVRSETPSGDTRNKNKFVGGHGIVDDSADDGLIYMRARYYDSETGRFISRDPIEGSTKKPSTFNFYLYCNNSPVMDVDIYGNMSMCEFKEKVRKFLEFLNRLGIKAEISGGLGIGGSLSVKITGTGQIILGGSVSAVSFGLSGSLTGNYQISGSGIPSDVFSSSTGTNVSAGAFGVGGNYYGGVSSSGGYSESVGGGVVVGAGPVAGSVSTGVSGQMNLTMAVANGIRAIGNAIASIF